MSEAMVADFERTVLARVTEKQTSYNGSHYTSPRRCSPASGPKFFFVGLGFGVIIARIACTCVNNVHR